MRVLVEKALLKRAAKSMLPPSVITRPKQPYRAPDAAAFFGPGQPEFVREFTSEGHVSQCGYFHPAKLRQLTRKLETSVRDNRPISHRDSLVWMSALSTHIWHHHFINNNKDS